ncbi:MAG: MerR family transcriptional regulator [Thermomicrobiales bacterium]|jgi:DNA-binding transcriptional MerR regulator|nr:MerR family transcriptional regulator [Thermomicrobiales bacterium]
MTSSGGGRNQLEGARKPPPGRLPPLPIAAEPNRYALGDLERETGVPGRTIRYYISEGLLPPAYGRGPGATYDLGHLARLQMIQTLKNQHLPLADIRQRLSDMSNNEILALLNIQASPAEDTWRRIELHPDIELHVRVRSANNRALERAADLIVGLAQPVIERMEAGE